MGFRIAVLSLSERCSWGESGWIGISGLDARWAAGMLALESLLDSWESAPGRGIEVIPQLKPPVTRDFGVGGSSTPPGGASDLAQTLPPGNAPYPRLLLLVSLCIGETEVLRR